MNLRIGYPFWSRLWAALIDAFAVGLTVYLIGLGWLNMVLPEIVTSLFGSAAAFTYFWLLESRVGHGQTLGYRIMGLRLVDAQGGIIDLKRSFYRNAWFSGIELISTVVANLTVPNSGASIAAECLLWCFTIFNFVFIIFHPQRRSAVDILTDTVLVFRERTDFHQLTKWNANVGLTALVVTLITAVGIPFLPNGLVVSDAQQVLAQKIKAETGARDVTFGTTIVNTEGVMLINVIGSPMQFNENMDDAIFAKIQPLLEASPAVGKGNTVKVVFYGTEGFMGFNFKLGKAKVLKF